LKPKAEGNKSPSRVLWELDQASNIHSLSKKDKLAHKIGTTYQATFKEKDLYERVKHH